MFKPKNISQGIIYYSDLIPELEHIFTTRQTILYTASPKSAGTNKHRGNNTSHISEEDVYKNSTSDTGLKRTDDNTLQNTENINKKIAKNIAAVCEYLNITKENLITANQTHSSNVEFVSIEKTSYPNTDALILTNFSQAIYLNFADCIPVILYDKRANIGAIAHAGWRGTAKSIAVKTIKKMLDYSHSNIDDIYALIGPGISDCCYETGMDVVNEIRASVKNPAGLIKEKNGAFYVNLKLANARQLTELGVLQNNIDICPFCTSCRNDLFFSYRKENGTVNRHSAVIKLKQQSEQ